MNPRLVFIVVGVYAVGTNALILAGVLPAVAMGLGTTESVAGLGLTVFALTYALTGPFIPVFLVKLDRKTIMIGSLLVFICGTLLSALSTNVAVFMVSRAVVAVAAAAFPPQAMAVALAITKPEAHGRAVGFVAAGILLSIATGVPIGAVVGDLWGYRAAFIFVAALGCIGVAGVCFLPHTPRPERVGIGEQFAPLRTPAVAGLAVCSVLFAASQFGVTTFLAPILKDAAGLDPNRVALVLVLYGVCGAAASTVAGRLVDRLGGYRIAHWGYVLIVLTTPLFSLSGSLTGALIVIALWSLAQNLTFPAQQLEIGRLNQGNPATVFALNSAAIQLGGAVGAATSSVVVARLGVAWVAPVAVIPAAMGLVVLAMVAGRVGARGGQVPRSVALVNETDRGPTAV